MDADPVQAYQALYEGAFGTKNAFADTLIKATPCSWSGLGSASVFAAEL
jgi:simple sugar transport system permease protein